jgi:uncharacterized membrane protein
MCNNISSDNVISNSAIKGAVTGALIGARFFGPPGIAIGATIGGLAGFILDD